MSQQIENQIVKMQFDNANFEKNVQQSMSTIEKLKHALHFDKVDMTPLQQAFSETEATATRAGFHIRDIWLKVGNIIEQEVAQKVVNAGKKIFNALTFEGINDGFKEYELKMGSIQTIMAGTGESLATVNRYLDELNKYSDQTIYSFSDMTQNIGKFTNAGVKLKDAVAAIKGIANEAAISGANANEASRAMYNFAQALSAGYVKLIDWKSIENANMATKGFKEALLEVGVACGTVEKDADGMYKILTENNQGRTMDDAVSGTKNFNDSLQYQWMTTEVLTNTLKLYATNVEDLSDAEREAYELELKKLGLDEEQIKRFEELGTKATKAASEIKTFSMLMDTLKEAIGSGWATTWQILIGDFEQAKSLWTEVGNSLGGLIDGMSDARNALLTQGLTTGWEKFITIEGKIIPQSERFRDVLVDIAHDHGILTKEQADTIDSTNALIDSFHELKWVTGDLLKESVNDYYNTLKSMNEEELEDFGVSNMELAQLEALNKGLKDGSVNADEFAESMIKLGGRENILKGLSNVFNSLKDTLKPIREAFESVFKPISPETLYDITDRFRKFTEELKVTEDAANTLRTSFSLAFGGIKLVIDAFLTTIKGASKLVLPIFNLFDAIFGLVGKIISALTGSKGVLDVADKFAKFGDKINDKYLGAMQKLADYINKVANAIRGLPESPIFNKIHDGVVSAIEALKEFWEEFKNMPVIQEMVSDFWQTVAKIEEVVTPMVDSVKKAFGDLKADVKKNFNFETLNKVLTNVYDKVKKFMTLVKDFASRIKTFFSNLKEGKNVVESFKESFGDIVDKIKELKDNIFTFFDDLFSKSDELGDKFNLVEIQQAIHDFVSNITPDQITMLAVAGSFMLIALNMLRLSEAMKNAVDAFTGIGLALKNVINSYVKKQKSTILQVAEAIVIVAASLWVLAQIPQAKLERALGAIITLTGLLTGLTVVLTLCGIAMHKLGGGKSMVELASGLVLVTGAFMMSALTLKLLEYVNLKGVLPKLLTLAGIMLALVGMSTLMSKIDKFSKGSLTMVAVAGAMFIAASALAKLGEIPADSLDKSLDGMLKIMVGMAAITFAAGKVGVFSAVGLIAIVLTLDKLLPSIEKLVTYDYTKIDKGLQKNEQMLKKLGGILVVMVALGALAGNRIKGVGIGLLAISATFGILAGIAKLASMLDPRDLAQGEQFIWSMAGMIALIELCSIKASIGGFGGKGSEGSKAFIRIATAMGILLGIAKLASMMSVKGIVKGEVAVLGLIGLVGALLYVASKSRKSEGIVKSVTAMIFALSTILAEVALLSMIPIENMVPALGAIISVILALAALAAAVSYGIKALKEDEKLNISGLIAIISAVVAVIALGVILNALANQPIDGVKAAAQGVTMVIGAVATVMVALSRIKTGFNMGQVETFFLSVFMVAGIAAMLSVLTDYMQQHKINASIMVQAAEAIAIVLAGLSPALFALSMLKWDSDYAGMAKVVAGAIAALIFVAGAIGLLSRFGGNGDKLIDSAVALSLGLVAVCVPIAVLGAVGKYCEQVDTKSMATIVIAALGTLAGVAGALWFLSNYGGSSEKMIAAAQALAITLLAISVPIAVLGVVGELCKTTNPVAMIVAVAGSIAALVAVCKLLPELAANLNLEMCNTLNAAMPALLKTMVAIGVLSLAISAAGLLSAGNPAVAFTGAIVIVEALVIFFGSLAILGAALNEFDWLGPALVRGLDFLVIVAEKLGVAAGALIGGFGVGLSNQLDPIADSLTKFSGKMITFSKNMSQVNKEAVDGCKNIAAAVLYLGAADFISAITRWVNLFGLNFGEQDLGFKELGKAMADFCNELKDVPQDAVAKASQCSVIAKRLAEISGTFEAKGGLAGLIFGDKEGLREFGDNISAFGGAMIRFCSAVKNLPDNSVELAQRACNTVLPMLNLTQNLANSGGWIQDVLGEKDLGEFGRRLATFVAGIIVLVTSLMSLEELNPDYGAVIQRCADATAPLIELSNALQNMGGKLADIVGDNTLDKFGETIGGGFATGLRRLVLVLSGIEQQVPNYPVLINRCKIAVGYLVDLANSLHNMGGFLTDLVGDNTLDRFGDTLVPFAQSLKDYVANIKDIEAADIIRLNSSIQELISMAMQATEVPSDSFSGLKFAIQDLMTVLTETTSSTTGEEIITGIRVGIDNNYPLLNERLLLLFGDIKLLFDENMALLKFVIYGANMINGILLGITQNLMTVLIPGVVNIHTQVKFILDTKFNRESFKTYGENLVLGIEDGIKANIDQLLETIDDMVEEAAARIPEGWQENSPSKLTYGYGKFFALGLINSISDYSDQVVATTAKMSEDIVDSANSIISSIKNVIDGNIDAQPTIRPVLDTTDLTEKAKNINKLFDSSDLSLAYNAAGAIRHRSEAKAYSEEAKSKDGNTTTSQVNFTQNNYSPKALSRYEIYRQTRNQLSQLKGAMG